VSAAPSIWGEIHQRAGVVPAVPVAGPSLSTVVVGVVGFVGGAALGFYFGAEHEKEQCINRMRRLEEAQRLALRKASLRVNVKGQNDDPMD